MKIVKNTFLKLKINYKNQKIKRSKTHNRNINVVRIDGNSNIIEFSLRFITFLESYHVFSMVFDHQRYSNSNNKRDSQNFLTIQVEDGVVKVLHGTADVWKVGAFIIFIIRVLSFFYSNINFCILLYSLKTSNK